MSRFILGALAVLALSLPALATAHAQPQRDANGELEMLTRINVLRGEQGLPPLERHPGLDEAARVHSEDMAIHAELVHVSERTGDPSSRVSNAAVDARLVAENIAHHSSTTDGAYQAILDSEAHRAQLVDARHTHIGLAAMEGEDGVYITQVLARLEPPAPPVRALPPPSVMEAPPPAPNAPPPQFAPAPQTPSAQQALGQNPPARTQQGPLPRQVAPPQSPQARFPQQGRPVQPRPQQQARQQARQQTMPSLRVPAGHRRVAGYWLYHGVRWWYFPVPQNARPGMVLQPDPRVQGPPPGYRGAVRYHQTSRQAPQAPARYR